MYRNALGVALGPCDAQLVLNPPINRRVIISYEMTIDWLLGDEVYTNAAETLLAAVIRRVGIRRSLVCRSMRAHYTAP